jgi:hypothetical protein
MMRIALYEELALKKRWINSYVGRKSCRCSVRELHGYAKEIEILSTSTTGFRGAGKRIVSTNLNGVMVLGLRTQLKWRRWLRIFSRNFIQGMIM